MKFSIAFSPRVVAQTALRYSFMNAFLFAPSSTSKPETWKNSFVKAPQKGKTKRGKHFRSHRSLAVKSLLDGIFFSRSMLTNRIVKVFPFSIFSEKNGLCNSYGNERKFSWTSFRMVLLGVDLSSFWSEMPAGKLTVIKRTFNNASGSEND